MTLPTPYYDRDGITIYHGDCLEILPHLDADVVVTDPPYGIAYETNWNRADGDRPRSIANDGCTFVRDRALGVLDRLPAMVFGSWRAPAPHGAKLRVLWEKGGSSGMGDLLAPWRPNVEDIFVIGTGWVQVTGRRESAVIKWNALCGRQSHPNEKPVGLLRHLLLRCPPGTILDPFMGSGTTLVAAKLEGRRAIGIELEEKYCEIAVKRLAQGVLDFG